MPSLPQGLLSLSWNRYGILRVYFPRSSEPRWSGALGLWPDGGNDFCGWVCQCLRFGCLSEQTTHKTFYLLASGFQHLQVPPWVSLLFLKRLELFPQASSSKLGGKWSSPSLTFQIFLELQLCAAMNREYSHACHGKSLIWDFIWWHIWPWTVLKYIVLVTLARLKLLVRGNPLTPVLSPWYPPVDASAPWVMFMLAGKLGVLKDPAGFAPSPLWAPPALRGIPQPLLSSSSHCLPLSWGFSEARTSCPSLSETWLLLAFSTSVGLLSL